MVLLYLLTASFACSVSAVAAEAYSADAVKAEFLYRFAGYVEWPTDLPAGAPFTIAVAGDGGVFAALQHLMPGRTIQNRPVEVRKIAAAAELENVQILYLPPRAAAAARKLIAAAAERAILIVSDDDGGLASGSVVNFVQTDHHVRFEISLTAAERGRLKINSGLLSVAARVEGARPHADASCWPSFTFAMAPVCSIYSLAAADPGRPAYRRVRLALAVGPR